MEYMWRNEGRKGQPRNNDANTNKQQPPMGFEGMNFEQKRRPYREDERDTKENSDEMNGRRTEIDL